MADVSALSIAFIERRPLAAARVLSSVEPEDAAGFLETVPSRFAALAFTHMGAWQAHPVLTRMEKTAAAAILRQMDYAEGAAILRLTPPEVRAGLLEELPEKLRRDFRTSLSFPGDTVGAHMNVLVLTLKPRHSVKEARDHVRRGEGTDISQIFVIDDAGRPLGVVDCGTLLRHPPEASLGDIMDDNVTVLSARARLATVIDLKAWDDTTHLPVLSRRKQIIGVLSRKAARLALDHGHLDETAAQSSMLARMGEAFFTSAVGVVQLFFANVQSPGAFPPEGDRR